MGIVVLTMYAGDDQLFGALEAGASAFVPKDAPAEDVIAAARHAAVSPRAFTATDLAGAMQRRLSPSGPQLSPREREVLGLLADGLGVAAISKQLYISESTTKTHISKVYEKLGAANRAQALMTAHAARSDPTLRDDSCQSPEQPQFATSGADDIPGVRRSCFVTCTGYEGDPGALRGRAGSGGRPVAVSGAGSCGSPAEHGREVGDTGECPLSA